MVCKCQKRYSVLIVSVNKTQWNWLNSVHFIEEEKKKQSSAHVFALFKHYSNKFRMHH